MHSSRNCILTLISLIVSYAWLAKSNARAEAALNVIDVGSRKQLFIDSRFIESSHNVRSVMNPPRQDGQVLLQADQPWERGRSIGIYSFVVKENGRVRIWYDLRRASPEAEYHNRS